MLEVVDMGGRWGLLLQGHARDALRAAGGEAAGGLLMLLGLELPQNQDDKGLIDLEPSS